MAYVKITEEAFNLLLEKISNLNHRLSSIEGMIEESEQEDNEIYSIIDDNYLEAVYTLPTKEETDDQSLESLEEKVPKVIFKK